MQWTLDQLHQFVTTAEQGSFSAAARTLGKAQSAVSTAISHLEADLDVELFDRSHRNAQLTRAGEVLLSEARELLRQAESLDNRARALSSGNEAKLTIAFDEALPFMAIGALIREIASRFPDIELTQLNGTATEVAAHVNQRRADVAFHFVRGTLPACFDQHHIGTVPQEVFVADGHPLLQFVSVDRKHLAQYRQLVMEVDDVQETAYSPRLWRSDSFYSIADMVADNLGWAILPTNIGAYQAYRQRVRPLSCPSLTLPPLAVRMLWYQGWHPTLTVQWVRVRFAELIHQVQSEA